MTDCKSIYNFAALNGDALTGQKKLVILFYQNKYNDYISSCGSSIFEIGNE